jgi:mannan endo-1,4-beta-mannosidase
VKTLRAQSWFHALVGPLLLSIACGGQAQTPASIGTNPGGAESPKGKRVTMRTANPAANPDAAKVLQYLYGLPKRPDARVLAGQNIGHANEDLVAGYAKYITSLRQSTDLAPSVLGVDYGYEQIHARGMAAANRLLIRHWNEGGLVTISMSPGNPWTGGGLRQRSTGGLEFREVVTKGTEAYERWHRLLDGVAAALAQLRDAGVVVLWRPLHEMNGDFFWWSAGHDADWATPEDFRALWRDMFDYLSREKKLDNLLWVYAPSYQSNDGLKPVAYYYPGGEYVDVVGLDYYENTMDHLAARGSYRTLVGLGKPFALTEVGPAFWLSAHPRGKFDTRIVIDGIRKKYPSTTYFVFWHGWSSLLLEVKMGLVQNQHARELLSDPWVVPLGKVERRTGG